MNTDKQDAQKILPTEKIKKTGEFTGEVQSADRFAWQIADFADW
jgi:hypothetical protein